MPHACAARTDSDITDLISLLQIPESLLCALAAASRLLWAETFPELHRLRPDNTYLLLDDFGEGGVEDTGLTTELGVMSNEEEEHREQQVYLVCFACQVQRNL